MDQILLKTEKEVLQHCDLSVTLWLNVGKKSKNHKLSLSGETKAKLTSDLSPFSSTFMVNSFTILAVHFHVEIPVLYYHTHSSQRTLR